MTGRKSSSSRRERVLRLLANLRPTRRTTQTRPGRIRPYMKKER